MEMYTHAMLEIIDMPRAVNVNGRSVAPGVLFSPALCEPMLYWHAQSLAVQLHDQPLMDVSILRDDEAISSIKIAKADRNVVFTGEGIKGIGLAASLLLIAEAGDRIIKPARLSANFDYGPVIRDFREQISRCYDHGNVIEPNDHVLNDFFYENIIRPSAKLNESKGYKPGVAIA